MEHYLISLIKQINQYSLINVTFGWVNIEIITNAKYHNKL